MLTCHPAGVDHATCMFDGPISKPGGMSDFFWPVGLSSSQCEHVFKNSVRSYEKKAPGKDSKKQSVTGVAFLGFLEPF